MCGSGRARARLQRSEPRYRHSRRRSPAHRYSYGHPAGNGLRTLLSRYSCGRRSGSGGKRRRGRGGRRKRSKGEEEQRWRRGGFFPPSTAPPPRSPFLPGQSVSRRAAPGSSSAAAALGASTESRPGKGRAPFIAPTPLPQRPTQVRPAPPARRAAPPPRCAERGPAGEGTALSEEEQAAERPLPLSGRRRQVKLWGGDPDPAEGAGERVGRRRLEGRLTFPRHFGQGEECCGGKVPPRKAPLPAAKVDVMEGSRRPAASPVEGERGVRGLALSGALL